MQILFLSCKLRSEKYIKAKIFVIQATVAQLVEQLIRNQFALLLGYTLFSSISCQLTVQFICQFGRRQATQGVSYGFSAV